MSSIKTRLSRDSQSNPNDVLEIKNALYELGYYEIPSYGLTPYADKQMFSAIRKFQMDNHLVVDGVINPDGETIDTINQRQNMRLIPVGKSPIQRCPECGAPHGGSKGDLCPQCDVKK